MSEEKKPTRLELAKRLDEMTAAVRKLEGEVIEKNRRNTLTEAELAKVEKDRLQLHGLVKYLREDRAALVRSINVLSAEGDLKSGRSVLQKTWEPSPWAPLNYWGTAASDASYALAEPKSK